MLNSYQKSYKFSLHDLSHLSVVIVHPCVFLVRSNRDC